MFASLTPNDMKNLNLITIISVMVLSVSTMFGQSIQKGFVFEYNDKMEKVPLANVEIVVTNAASTVSDAKGEFSLRFRQLKPGDRIIVRRCIKSGYSIADETSLEHLYITGDESRINIYLCRTEKLMEVRRNMVRHATEKATSRYEEDQRQLAVNLQQQHITKEDYEKKLEELQREYETKLDNIDNYIDRFVKLDLTALTAEEKRIMEMVRDGNFESAIAAYDKLDLSGHLAMQRKNISRLTEASESMSNSEKNLHRQQKELRNAVLRQCDLLRMQGGPNVAEKIATLIRELAMVDTTNVYNMLVYARLMLGHADFKEAYKVYESLTYSAQSRNDSATLLRAQCYMALTLSRMGRREEGVRMMEHCLPLYDSIRLSRSDTLSLLRDEAEYCNMLGLNYLRTKQYEKADHFFRRSILGLHSLRVETQLKDLDSQYAVLLSQAANCMMERWGDESSQMSREAVRILEDLSITKPYLYEARLAYAYKSLGCILMKHGQQEEAEVNLLAAETHYRRAIQRNKKAYSRFLASCLSELGELYQSQKDYNRALMCLEEAQKIYMDEINGQIRYADDLSEINYRIGGCAYHLGDYNKCLQCNLVSLADLEPYFKEEPEVYREKMGVRLLHLYNVYCRLRDFKKAIFYINRAVEVDPGNERIRRNYQESLKIQQLYPEP